MAISELSPSVFYTEHMCSAVFSHQRFHVCHWLLCQKLKMKQNRKSTSERLIQQAFVLIYCSVVFLLIWSVSIIDADLIPAALLKIISKSDYLKVYVAFFLSFPVCWDQLKFDTLDCLMVSSKHASCKQTNKQMQN